MTTPNTDPNAGGDQTPPKAPDGAEPTKQEASPAPPPKADPPKDPPAGAKDATGAEPPKAPPPKVLDAETDEIPENEELFQLSKKALNARLARHTKRELKDRFGSDDPDEIKGKLDKLAVFEEEAEKKRLASLSEVEKANERATKAEDEKKKAEEALQRTVDAQAFAEYDSGAKVAIAKYFDDDADTVDYALDRLKKHVLALDDSDLKHPDKVFDAWAKEYAEKHPKLAKKAPEAPPPPAKKKIGLHTGADPSRPEKDDPKLAEKTARPGQPNSMTRAEYAEWKRGRGLTA